MCYKNKPIFDFFKKIYKNFIYLCFLDISKQKSYEKCILEYG